MGLREAHEAMRHKIAVVVGGAAGHLGRGTTLGLVREGVRVICCDNDREGLAAIVPEVQAMGGRISAHYAEVTDPASLDAFFDKVEDETGHIDILVNVPGGVARALFDRTTRDSHARDIRLNYGYVVDSCHRAQQGERAVAASSTSPRSRRTGARPRLPSMPAPRRRRPTSAARWRSNSAPT
jgi:NAD(P)-dependent dehydrogenase (short-subunit alcohol dehydrogenase family)